MKNFLLDLAKWRERLEDRPLALFLDYDGTLAAIAPTPPQARMSRGMRRALKMLAGAQDVKVAVVSGRALEDLQEMVKVPGLSYVGSHGAEFSARAMASRMLPRGYLQKLKGINKMLMLALQEVPGVLFEHKPVSCAVHYRNVLLSSERKVRRIIMDICRGPLLERSISLLHGKKVIEIMPSIPMDKGQAVQSLWRKWGEKKFFPIFIGDDRTDESAFSVLGACGLTIRVGRARARSAAEYYFESVNEVQEFLRSIVRFRGL